MASGLNFPLLGYIFEKRNCYFFKPEENEKQAIFARLLANKNLPDTCEAFFDRFGMTSSNYFMEPFGNYQEALEAIAVGLSNDKTGAYHSRLLEKQQHVLSALSNKWLGEQERPALRAKRLLT